MQVTLLLQSILSKCWDVLKKLCMGKQTRRGQRVEACAELQFRTEIL